MFKRAFSLSCVSGSLKGTLTRPEDMVYAYINNTDMTFAHNKSIAAFCDNSIVPGSHACREIHFHQTLLWITWTIKCNYHTELNIRKYTIYRFLL